MSAVEETSYAHDWPFSGHYDVIAEKSTDVTNNINYSSIPFRFIHKPLPVSQHSKYQGPGTEAAKWSAVVIKVISYTAVEKD